MTSHERLRRASPESLGVDAAAVRRLVGALDEEGGAHSLLLLRHGAVCAEAWWTPHEPRRTHQMFSVSKAFTAMAVGIAVDEGLLRVDDRVVDLLPDAAPSDPGGHLAEMRVEHLLTMTSGHASSSMDGQGRVLGRAGDDWVRDILGEPVERRPGSAFVYDTGATYLLSAILHRRTGLRLLDYLAPRLLEPLGIADASWEQDPRGIDAGGFGLSITTEDMAAFGHMLLRRGRFGGRRLVPEGWVDRALSRIVDSAPQGWDPDWSAGYGYQLWRCAGADAARADGAFGQFIVVWPEHDAVIAMTSGTVRTQVELRAVWDALGGAFGEPVPDAAPGEVMRFPGLHARFPAGAARSPREERILAAYEGEGAAGTDGPLLAVSRVGDLLDVRLRLRAPGHESLDARFLAGHGVWHDGGAFVDGSPLAAAYAWAEDEELELVLVALGAPFSWSITVCFDGDDGVVVSAHQNVSFGDPVAYRATGRRRAPF